MFKLPVRLKDRVRIHRRLLDDLPYGGELIAFPQHAEPKRLPYLPDQLQVRRDIGTDVQVKLDQRDLHEP